MKQETDILKRINRHDGMTVPEDYFAGFTERMARMLPDREPAASSAAVQRRTLWAVVRPYVYMAAMFAGVWCMLKMFTIMSGTSDLRPMDSNPVLAEAFSNEAFFNDYISPDINQWDVLDEMMEDGSLGPSFDEDEIARIFEDNSGHTTTDNQESFILPDHEQ